MKNQAEDASPKSEDSSAEPEASSAQHSTPSEPVKAAKTTRGGQGRKGGGGGGGGRKQAEKPTVLSIQPIATPARMRPRHWGIILSFLTFVSLPAAATYWYLYEVAADQYSSSVGFSVQKEDTGSAVEIFGGITELSSGGVSDSDILYEFIQSQNLVQLIDKKLDLRALYSKPENDPIFAYNAPGAIEDLLKYWGKMVDIFYDTGTGLIEIRTKAFSPDDAQAIAQAIFDESSVMINRLSAIAREDTTRYARLELDRAVARLKLARQAITKFRNDNQIVDPNADIQGQMGLLNTLQAQLAAAMIDLDLLQDTTRTTDPRLEQANRKIKVIEQRIREERKKFGVGDGSGSAFSTIIAEFEGLSVDREFAERSYLSALTAFDIAQSEGQRQSRYLAAYVEPTLAESSQYPQKFTILSLTTLFIFMLWSIVILVGYSVKDRR